MLKLKREESEHLLLSWLYSSQAYESLFRRLRSMSTTRSTVVNSRLLETIHRIQRIQLQSDISSSTFEDSIKVFRFPRFESSNTDKKCSSNYPLPHGNNIIKVLDKAKEDAFLEITSVGMEIDITACKNILIE